jgi:hypothetical protein
MPTLLRFKPGSIGQYFEGCCWSGNLKEVHHSSCAHCQTGTEFPSMKEMMNYVEICRGCMKLICLECAGKPCRPWEKECERQEMEGRLRRRVEMAGWECY